jgi:hypothetical protein
MYLNVALRHSVMSKVFQLATELLQVVIDQSYSLTPQGPRRTNTQSPDNRAYMPPWTNYWTDFKSENGFQKVLQLAIKLVQVLIDQFYLLTPQWPIRTKCPSQIIGQALWTDYWTYFESENGFENVLQLATKLVQVVRGQRYSLTPQGPIRTKTPIP